MGGWNSQSVPVGIRDFSSDRKLAKYRHITLRLLVWMVVTILKKGRFDGKELKGNEEYGYGDQPKK